MLRGDVTMVETYASSGGTIDIDTPYWKHTETHPWEHPWESMNLT